MNKGESCCLHQTYPQHSAPGFAHAPACPSGIPLADVAADPVMRTVITHYKRRGTISLKQRVHSRRSLKHASAPKTGTSR